MPCSALLRGSFMFIPYCLLPLCRLRLLMCLILLRHKSGVVWRVPNARLGPPLPLKETHDQVVLVSLAHAASQHTKCFAARWCLLVTLAVQSAGSGQCPCS